MPLLSQDYISKWYYLEDINDSNNIILVETCNQSLITSAESQQLIAGDAGVHSITPSQYEWNLSLTSPALIINNVDPTDSRIHKDLFTFVKSKHDYLLNHLNKDPEEYPLDSSLLLNKFTIQLSDELNMTAELFGPLGNYFTNNFAVDYATNRLTSKDFISRIVKFYDVNFYIGDIKLKLMSCDITGTYSYSKNYFINSMTSMPFYGLQFFRLNGKISFLVPVNEWNSFAEIQQEFNRLSVEQANISIQIENEYFNLGQINLKNSLTFNLTGGLTTIEATFETYARYRE
jgi:hypothetical protein